MSNDQKPQKSPKLKLKSVKGMENSQKKQLFTIIAVVSIVLFLMVSIVVKDRPVPNRSAAPTFEDTTPTPTTAEELTISRLQVQMSEMDKEIERRKREEERLSSSLRAELEKTKAEQNQREARTLEMMKDLQRQLEEARRAAEQAPPIADSPKGASDGATPAIKRDEKGNPYLVPPMPQGGSDTKPVVPPVNQVPHPVLEPQQPWTMLDEPIVLSGTDVERKNVLRGSERGGGKVKGKQTVGSFLPMGSFNRVSILTGADFGAGRQTQSNPQPVLMRIMSDSIMPNDANYELKHCSAMGSGYGDMSSERVYISITRLSCVDVATGKALETPIVAYVADTDGKLGMRGKLVNREGAVMARAMLAGFAEGASDMFNLQAQNLESTITGAGIHQTIDTNRAGEVGAYGGASKAMEMLADHYLDQAKSIFPVIEINSGRNATIVVQQGQHLNWQDANSEEGTQ